MLSIGIVGLPNVGKSTLFNTLTKAKLAVAQNFPFCTIEPNVGIVEVPDVRLEKIYQLITSDKKVASTIKFVDIAGLVKGASSGEGLGNKFLANIRECNAVCMVVRVFEDDNIIHVSGKINPQEDVEVINTELILADLETITKRRAKEEKNAKTKNKKSLKRISVLEKLMTHLDNGKLANSLLLEEEEIELIKDLHLITLKPFMYVLNISEEQLEENKEIINNLDPQKNITDNIWGQEINFSKFSFTDFRAFLMDNQQIAIVPICAKLEEDLLEMSDEEQVEYLISLGVKETGLDLLIKTGYSLLGLINYFTAGQMESRSWTIKKGSTACQGAGEIHTDFIKKFIKAEVCKLDDFMEYKGWNGCKDKGLVRIEGKEYVLQDGEVVFFRIGL